MIEYWIRRKIQDAQTKGQVGQELLGRRLLEDFRTHMQAGLEDIPLTIFELATTEVELTPDEMNETAPEGLTGKEICIYDTLHANKGAIVSYEQLISDCFSNEGKIGALHTAVSRLKGKISDQIINRKNSGYMIPLP